MIFKMIFNNTIYLNVINLKIFNRNINHMILLAMWYGHCMQKMLLIFLTKSIYFENYTLSVDKKHCNWIKIIKICKWANRHSSMTFFGFLWITLDCCSLRFFCHSDSTSNVWTESKEICNFTQSLGNNLLESYHILLKVHL